MTLQPSMKPRRVTLTLSSRCKGLMYPRLITYKMTLNIIIAAMPSSLTVSSSNWSLVRDHPPAQVGAIAALSARQLSYPTKTAVLAKQPAKYQGKARARAQITTVDRQVKSSAPTLLSKRRRLRCSKRYGSMSICIKIVISERIREFYLPGKSSPTSLTIV